MKDSAVFEACSRIFNRALDLIFAGEISLQGHSSLAVGGEGQATRCYDSSDHENSHEGL